MHVRLLVRTHNMGGTAVRALLIYAKFWHNQGQGRSQMQTLCICITRNVHYCAEASVVFSEEPACRGCAVLTSLEDVLQSFPGAPYPLSEVKNFNDDVSRQLAGMDAEEVQCFTTMMAVLQVCL